ncbi:MAG: polyprenyl synthetase family protein, partial [Planctomycetes bacterium]|nr:polyprenyl synthetase family protein [Planctomycetota bacterium]
HTYSLIHDDLPAMDDDDLRRGQPTVHVAFDEATAILAGDGMLTEAFRVLAHFVEDAELSRALAQLLSDAAGHRGMVGGQQDDLDAEGREGLGLEELRSIHSRKTGALIASALVAGALCADADDDGVAAMWRFGRELGQAFQIADDILDETASAEDLGKTAGKDAAAGKLTYPALMGLEGARAAAQEHMQAALDALAEVPNPSKLAWLARFVVERQS